MSRFPEEGSPIRILAARNALFEVDLDLGRWSTQDTNHIDHFPQRLVELIPTLREHKCMSGQPGGFILEMRKGTHLAHVVEHVLLELLHLADPDGRIYTGWTNPRRVGGEPAAGGVYTIHFQVTSTRQGFLAARSGVELVTDLLEDRRPSVDAHLDRLKESFSWHEID